MKHQVNMMDVDLAPTYLSLQCGDQKLCGTTIMPIHGLIHDGQLRACPCALLGLMYGLRRLYAIRYLGFQFVGDGIKGPTLSFSF